MAPSTPPPPDPSNAAPSTTAATRPLFQNPPRPPNPHPYYSPPPSRLASNPNPNYPQLAPRPPQPHPQDPSQLLYPVASYGRGSLSRPVPLPAASPSTRPQLLLPLMKQGFVRPNNMLIGSGTGSAAPTPGAGVMPGVVKGIPVSSSQHPKVGTPAASISDNMIHKDLRDGNKDDSLVTIRDRKVRIKDNSSLYALSRSWLRNGFSEETQQPQYLDTVKSLPRPLPVAAQAEESPDKEEKDKDEDSDYEHLSTKDLLQRHIKRAKRVRSRLREERHQRITRYKTRLALLLPPMVDQHFKNESAPAN